MSKEGFIAFMRRELTAADDYRKDFEEMWLDGYRAFYSEYPAGTKFRPGGSKLYYGLTRAKVLSAWQRECDILFNRPEPPWVIAPTTRPSVPMKRVADHLTETADPDLQQRIAEEGPKALLSTLTPEKYNEAVMELSTAASKEMTSDMRDVWEEDRMEVKIKQALLEKVITGTCVIKFGTCERLVSSWKSDATGFNYEPETVFSPTARYKSIFDIYVDPNAKLIVDNGTIENCDYIYERHPMTYAQLRSLIGKPAFDEDAIIACLKEGGNSVETTAETEMRSLVGGSTTTEGTGFDVYERTGYVTVKQLRESGYDVSDDDDLNIYNMVVWFCGNRILKVVQAPDKATKFPYFFCPHEISPGQIYGLSIPYKMRHSQELVNAGMRLFIDNKANASGPITFVNQDRWDDSDATEDSIKPWAVVPISAGPGERLGDVIHFQTIPDIGQSMIPLIEMAKHAADEESGVPAFSYAGQNSELTKATGGTASGMSMIMGAADLANKSAVRNIDDYLLSPLITALYHWFMQFGENDNAKGDLAIKATGTIGLMKKEVQAQRLTQLLTQSKIAPPVDPETGYKLWMKTLEAMDIDVTEFKDFEELKKAAPDGP